MKRLVAMALGLALALAGCAGSPPNPRFVGTWPAQVPSSGAYDDETAAWTRSGELHANFQQVAKLHALIKSPSWRAAWVARRAQRGRLSDAARAELMAAQQQADQEALEVVLVVTTWDRSENDLDRGGRSVWRIALVDADGNEVLPTEIKRDRRPEMVLRAEYEGVDDFARVYVAKFPRATHIYGDEVQKVGLRMSSPRGGIELTWQAAR